MRLYNRNPKYFAYDATIVSRTASYIYYSLPNYNHLNQCTNF